MRSLHFVVLSVLVLALVCASGSQESSFRCVIYQIVGMPEDGTQATPVTRCSRTCGGGHTLVGDVSAFFERNNINLAVETTINVPTSAVGPSNTINLDANITVAKLPPNRQQVRGIAQRATADELSRAQDKEKDGILITSNEVKMLVIRVSDKSGATVDSTKEEIAKSMFYDEATMKTVLEGCSNGKVTVTPVTGDNVVRGVMDMVSEIPVAGASYTDVTDRLRKRLEALAKQLDYTNIMYVLPDSVPLNGGLAVAGTWWPEVWLRSKTFKETSYQVHELGHNFGFAHSGTETNPYNDPTCYMGYSWTGEKKMCFNAAKTWHTGWYEDYHVRYDARYDKTAPALIELVGLDTLVKLIDGKKATDRNLVLKIMLDPDLVDTTLFLMFNRKPETGLNSGVKGDADKLVIVAQKWRGGLSTKRAALGAGESYTEAGVTVKNCAVKLAYPSTVSVLIYRTGDVPIPKCTDIFTPTPSTPNAISNPSWSDPTCTDKKKLNGDPWDDGGGPDFGCYNYAQKNNCAVDSKEYSNNETPDWKTGNLACCVCGGGDRGGNTRGLLTVDWSSTHPPPPPPDTPGSSATPKTRQLRQTEKNKQTFTFKTSQCDTCGFNLEIPTCCRGSWEGKCTESDVDNVSPGQPYTRAQGIQACKIECPDCKKNSGQAWTCCSGSWDGKCTDVNNVSRVQQYTWAQGLAACSSSEDALKFALDTTGGITKRFSQADKCKLLDRVNIVNTPSTDLSVAVLLASPAWSLPVILTVLCLV